VAGLILGGIGTAMAAQTAGQRGVGGLLHNLGAIGGCLGPIGTAILGGVLGALWGWKVALEE
jgi:hypothetical protein